MKLTESKKWAWAEVNIRSEWKEIQRHSPGTYFEPSKIVTERQNVWTIPDQITVYAPDWKQATIIPSTGRIRGLSARIKSQSAPGKYATGGHNWYMTTRFDVWINHVDGYVYHGFLITGGCNTTCKVYRTKENWVTANPRHRVEYNSRSKVYHVFKGKKRVQVCKHFPKLNEFAAAEKAWQLLGMAHAAVLNRAA